MITINLLPGPKKKRGAGLAISMPDFGQALGRVKDPLLLGAVGSWVVSLALVGFLFMTEQQRLARLQEEHSQVQDAARRFQNLLNEKERAERLQDSLEMELTAIRDIDAHRYVWPHILDEVARALPDFTWLESMDVLANPADLAPADTGAQPPVRFQINGRTSDIGAYTRFVRQLEASPWLRNVTPGATQTVVEEDKPLTAFSVTATFQQADSAFMQTVPLLQSIR